jgi:hypothetical protein
MPSNKLVLKADARADEASMRSTAKSERVTCRR